MAPQSPSPEQLQTAKKELYKYLLLLQSKEMSELDVELRYTLSKDTDVKGALNG